LSACGAKLLENTRDDEEGWNITVEMAERHWIAEGL